MTASFSSLKVTLSFKKMVAVRYSPSGKRTIPSPAASAASIACYMLVAFSVRPSPFAP